MKKYGIGGNNSATPVYGVGGTRSLAVYGDGGIGNVYGGSSSIPFKLAESNITALTQDIGTFTRATTATVEDHQGVIREVLSGEVRFQEQRRVYNLLAGSANSEDLTDGYTVGFTATIDDFETISFSTDALSQFICPSVSADTNKDYVISFDAKAGTLSDFILFKGGTISAISLTSDWVRYSGYKTGDTGAFIFLTSGTTAGNFKVRNIQIEDTSGASEPTAENSYVSAGVLSTPYHGANVDGVKYFNNKYYDGIDCWGDSMIGAGTPSFYAQMGTFYGKSYNNGVGGETSTQIKTRFLLDYDLNDRLILIWAGRNNFTDPTTVKSDIAAMVAAIPHTNYIILSILNSDTVLEYSGGANYITLTQLNADLEALYPNNYIDVRETLVNAYDPDTPQDVIDFGRDVPPSTLRDDTLHLNGAGSLIAAQAAWDFIQEKGMEGAVTLSGIGRLGEIASTNKCTNNNANPTGVAMGTIAAFNAAVTNMTAFDTGAGALFGVVDGSAAIAAVGLDGTCTDGLLVKIDCTSGSGAAVIDMGGTTTNINAHSISAWVMADSGSTPSIQLNGGEGTVSTTNTTLTKLTSNNITPGATTRVFRFRVEIGEVGYFILNQLEEKTFSTSEIITKGLAATRNKDDLSYPTTYLPVNDCAGELKWTPTAAGQGTVYIHGAGSSTDSLSVLHDGTNIVVRKRLASINYDATKALTYTADTAYIIKWRLGTDGIDVWIEDVKGTNHVNITDASIGSAIYIGSDYAGASQQTGGIDDFTVYEGIFTDADMVNL